MSRTSCTRIGYRRCFDQRGSFNYCGPKQPVLQNAQRNEKEDRRQSRQASPIDYSFQVGVLNQVYFSGTQIDTARILRPNFGTRCALTELMFSRESLSTAARSCIAR